jgi:hypothetical protein
MTILDNGFHVTDSQAKKLATLKYERHSMRLHMSGSVSVVNGEKLYTITAHGKVAEQYLRQAGEE